MADGLRLELRQEVIDRTIAFIDHFKQLASRGLLFRAEAKPIEAVIPNLTNLVEQTCLALFFRGFDRLRQARGLEACLRNQFIGLRHIGVMVLAVVVAESPLGDDIAERDRKNTRMNSSNTFATRM